MSNQQFLMPGDYFFGQYDGNLLTLLGSCVAVTLWHPRLQLAALTHFLLPRGQRFDPQDTHYGEAVFNQLQADMARLGTQPSEYLKGLFGGGTQMESKRGSNLNVAAKNVSFSCEQFELLGWRIDQQALGGSYRRLSLDARTGKITCKDLQDCNQLRIRE